MVMLKNEGDSGQPLFVYTFYDMAKDSLSEPDRAIFDAYNLAALEFSRTLGLSPTEAINKALKQVPGAQDILAEYDDEVGGLMRSKSEGRRDWL